MEDSNTDRLASLDSLSANHARNAFFEVLRKLGGVKCVFAFLILHPCGGVHPEKY